MDEIIEFSVLDRKSNKIIPIKSEKIKLSKRHFIIKKLQIRKRGNKYELINGTTIIELETGDQLITDKHIITVKYIKSSKTDNNLNEINYINKGIQTFRVKEDLNDPSGLVYKAYLSQPKISYKKYHGLILQ